MDCGVEVLDELGGVDAMDRRDVLDFFVRGGEAADAADVVLHEDHGGLRVIVDDILDRHVLRDGLFSGSRFHDSGVIHIPL